MGQVYITKIHIDKVRHLQDIDIPISEQGMKHLILTGKNGSGKTSLINALDGYLNSVSTTNDPCEARKNLEMDENNLTFRRATRSQPSTISEIENRIEIYKKRIQDSSFGLQLTFNYPEDSLKSGFENGDYILAAFGAHRSFDAVIPEEIQKIKLKHAYRINENPRSEFLKYLLDLKMTQALAIANHNDEKAEEIQVWFDKIQSILRDIYEDNSLTLVFDEETYQFSIHTKDREPFDFNTASDGFSAILDIIINIIMRMQEQDKRVIEFTKPGIVLIDEVENHLHLEMQRRVLTYLTGLFPNIQFIVTTHSPFVVNSLDNAVIYDLENHTLVEDGLSDLSYSGVVQGYFRSDELSDKLEDKFNQYKKLISKDKLSDDDLADIARLDAYLDEIPDYLMPELSAEYKKLKLEFNNRKDIK